MERSKQPSKPQQGQPLPCGPGSAQVVPATAPLFQGFWSSIGSTTGSWVAPPPPPPQGQRGKWVLQWVWVREDVSPVARPMLPLATRRSPQRLQTGGSAIPAASSPRAASRAASPAHAASPGCAVSRAASPACAASRVASPARAASPVCAASRAASPARAAPRAVLPAHATLRVLSPCRAAPPVYTLTLLSPTRVKQRPRSPSFQTGSSALGPCAHSAPGSARRLATPPRVGPPQAPLYTPKKVSLPYVLAPPQLGGPQKQLASGPAKSVPVSLGTTSHKASSVTSTTSPCVSASCKTSSEEPTPMSRGGTAAWGLEPDVRDVGASAPIVLGKDAPIASTGATATKKPISSTQPSVGDLGVRPTDDDVPTTPPPFATVPLRNQAILSGDGRDQECATPETKSEQQRPHAPQLPSISNQKVQVRLPPRAAPPVQDPHACVPVEEPLATIPPANGPAPGLNRRKAAVSAQADFGSLRESSASAGRDVPVCTSPDQQPAPLVQPSIECPSRSSVSSCAGSARITSLHESSTAPGRHVPVCSPVDQWAAPHVQPGIECSSGSSTTTCAGSACVTSLHESSAAAGRDVPVCSPADQRSPPHVQPGIECSIRSSVATFVGNSCIMTLRESSAAAGRDVPVCAPADQWALPLVQPGIECSFRSSVTSCAGSACIAVGGINPAKFEVEVQDFRVPSVGSGSPPARGFRTLRQRGREQVAPAPEEDSECPPAAVSSSGEGGDLRHAPCGR